MDINGWYDEDILITCGCGESRYLGEMLKEEIEFVEKYMCEANSRDFHKMIQAIELQVYELRKAYEKWKAKDFKK